MTKRIPVRKNTTGNREQDAEDSSSASEGKRETVGKPTGKETVGKTTGKETVGKPTGKETVGKPTGKTPDMQNVWDITETVTEKRTMEELPPSTWEQVLQHLSPERDEVTGELSSRTGRVRQQEVTNESPTDHESDQDNDEDNSSEVNGKDD